MRDQLSDRLDSPVGSLHEDKAEIRRLRAEVQRLEADNARLRRFVRLTASGGRTMTDDEEADS